MCLILALKASFLPVNERPSLCEGLLLYFELMCAPIYRSSQLSKVVTPSVFILLFGAAMLGGTVVLFPLS